MNIIFDRFFIYCNILIRYLIFHMHFQSYVSFDKKDDKYWEKRNKNNVAARRSREARRLKENQISLRTAFLESENAQLKSALEDASETLEKQTLEKKMLIEKLKRYESLSPFMSNVD